MAQLFM